MNSMLLNLGKLGLAGASIVAIATLIVLTAPSAEHVITPAQADIIDIFPRAARSDTAFSQLMQDEGIEARPLDYNGNVVFFGAKSMSSSPRSALTDLQHKFVDHGINKKVHTKSLAERGLMDMFTDEHKVKALVDLKDPTVPVAPELRSVSKGEVERQGELAAEMLNGDIIPVLNHDDYISMSGIVPKHKDQEVDHLNLRQTWTPNKDGHVDVMDHTDGFRFIDLTKEEDGSTSMTSTWADKDFNAHKIKPDYDGLDSSVDTIVPACIGCSRTFRIEGLNKNNDPFTTNQYSSQSLPDDLSLFYEQSLERRGWTRTESQTPMSELFKTVPSLQGHDTGVTMFTRGTQNLNVFLTDDGTETKVTTVLEEKSLDKHDR